MPSLRIRLSEMGPGTLLLKPTLVLIDEPGIGTPAPRYDCSALQATWLPLPLDLGNLHLASASHQSQVQAGRQGEVGTSPPCHPTERTLTPKGLRTL